MWLGASAKTQQNPWELLGQLTLALVINFSYNDEIVYNKNFEQKLIKMKSLLNLWYPRNLTLCGRLTILKSFS